LRRPSWRDTRLVLGLLLVLASVALGASVVAAADRTTAVLVAGSALGPGHRLVEGDLQVARVRLTGPVASYLTPQTRLPAGTVVLRGLGAGELVPLSAVGPAATLDRRPVALPLTAPLPDGVRPGGQVDLWSSARDPAAGAAAAYRPPVRLVVAAQVVAVTLPSGGLAADQQSSVQVLVSETELPKVLDALANEARVAVVPVPGSAPPGVG
jgi:hypothetical protein